MTAIDTGLGYSRCRRLAMNFSGIVFFVTSFSCLCDEVQTKLLTNNAVFGSARWCGDTDKVVWQSIGDGIAITDLKSDSILQLTTSPKHSAPFCSPNGDYVFFYQDASGNAVSSIELQNHRAQSVPCMDKRVFLSGDMRNAVSTQNKCSDITLPWGTRIKVTKIDARNGYFSPIVLDWFLSNTRVLIGYRKKGAGTLGNEPTLLTALDVKTGIYQDLGEFPHLVARAHVTVNGEVVVFMSLDPRSGLPALYKFDIAQQETREQLHLGVRSFALSSKGAVGFLADGNREGHYLFLSKQVKSEAKRITGSLWKFGPLFSASGNQLIVMRLNHYSGQEGPEGPPVAASLFAIWTSNN